jgi:N-hydroxyarylamine O-acetyltransferase
MDINAYLKRIKYSGPRTSTADTLRQLHRAHLLTIPFENLDIHLGHTIVLDNEKFFEKIVRQGRGGFCYELNGLFAALLCALDFNVTMLSARVYLDGILGPEFDHMVLLVQLEERWLADVGFGALFMDPLRMDDKNKQIQRNYAYRIKQHDDNWKLMAREARDPWKAMYQFTLEPRQLEDYAEMCHWHQTSPRSWHTQNRICTRATSDGRVTLRETKLVIKTNHNRSEQVISTKEEYVNALKAYFGVEICEISGAVSFKNTNP